MKLIYVALALAASVIAAPADVEKRAFKHTKRPPPRTVSSWSGNYNDQYDDGIIGAKTLPNQAVSPQPFTGVIGTPSTYRLFLVWKLQRSIRRRNHWRQDPPQTQRESAKWPNATVKDGCTTSVTLDSTVRLTRRIHFSDLTVSPLATKKQLGLNNYCSVSLYRKFRASCTIQFGCQLELSF
ncbi:hypothetical protein BCR33DRAFT_403353 [Rhizoclosmatium globosum]|uniref:Uncharacterized protein n=1 Tax=Rhizoclosmatium globosum TaxID=329046 RepID=A0A1Y2CY33_9FUNG|nr:hypothetical protein BCR33DRAFT_403353 [Rhizoclosmatium globosum]|eukprot:ORY51949.1 hypothetical protein BCR33DRAFT_403353 [Rhizoclosmatium globosum]